MCINLIQTFFFKHSLLFWLEANYIGPTQMKNLKKTTHPLS